MGALEKNSWKRKQKHMKMNGCYFPKYNNNKLIFVKRHFPPQATLMVHYARTNYTLQFIYTKQRQKIYGQKIHIYSLDNSEYVHCKEFKVHKTFLNASVYKKVFKFFLKLYKESDRFIVSGKAFQRIGAATSKLLSPHPVKDNLAGFS